jgi:hypothetical protein
MPRYSVKAIVGPYYFKDEDGETCLTSDMHRFHADGHIHAGRIFDQLAGGAAKVYMYELVRKYAA